MDELATWLGHERRLLELLLFKLVEGRHLLAAGEARFLPLAAAEVERAMRRVQEAELARSILVTRLAKEPGILEEQLTLSALSRDSLEPHRTIFDDHRGGFLALVAEIEEVTRQNRRLAAQGAHDVDRLLALVGDPAELDAAMAGVGQPLATVGSRANQIESLAFDGDLRVDALRLHRSSLEDADLAETVMELHMAEAAYQAVLGATARLSMPSLANFLS